MCITQRYQSIKYHIVQEGCLQLRTSTKHITCQTQSHQKSVTKSELYPGLSPAGLSLCFFQSEKIPPLTFLQDDQLCWWLLPCFQEFWVNVGPFIPCLCVSVCVCVCFLKWKLAPAAVVDDSIHTNHDKRISLRLCVGKTMTGLPS